VLHLGKPAEVSKNVRLGLTAPPPTFLQVSRGSCAHVEKHLVESAVRLIARTLSTMCMRS